VAALGNLTVNTPFNRFGSILVSFAERLLRPEEHLLGHLSTPLRATWAAPGERRRLAAAAGELHRRCREHEREIPGS